MGFAAVATKPASVDRLAWDKQGLELRFQHHAPTLSVNDRDALVMACLNAPELFGFTPAELFEQVRRQLAAPAKKRR